VKALNIKALHDFNGYVVDKISCQKMGTQVNLEFDGRCGPQCHNCSTLLPKHRITSGKIEGFNNLVSRVVHRACGITTLAYAWLKFRQLSIQPI
jgi:hypothetical protein